MKKLKWLILVMCLVLGLSVFAACGGDNGGTNNTKVDATGISLAPARALEIGQNTVLAAVVDPVDATTTVTWKSSDDNVATVSTTGLKNGTVKVTAVGVGEATITATAGEYTATCTFTITAHVTPYYFIVGQSGAAYFNWDDNIYRDILDTEEARVLSPVDGSDEKVFKTTIDLFAGDQFKFCKLTESSDANKWDNQLGGSEAEDVTANDLKVTGATEKTVLPSGTRFSGGNPPSFTVAEEGKYEITIDLSGDAAEISYKKTGATDPVAWSYTVGFHGSWGNVPNAAGDGEEWNTINFGTATFDKDHLTATADIVLQEANGFGVKTMKNGAQVGWFNSDQISLAEGVTTITKNAGNNATCTAAGTYNVTITMNEDGSIKTILFNSFTAAPAAE